jgi:hypothetical protein
MTYLVLLMDSSKTCWPLQDVVPTHTGVSDDTEGLSHRSAIPTEMSAFTLLRTEYVTEGSKPRQFAAAIWQQSERVQRPQTMSVSPTATHEESNRLQAVSTNANTGVGNMRTASGDVHRFIAPYSLKNMGET